MIDEKDVGDFGVGIREFPHPSFNGMRVVTDATLVDYLGWDFGWCRSPPRAARRFKRFGARNKLIRRVIRAKSDVYRVGDMLVMHPDIWISLQAQAGKLADANPNKDHPR